MLKRLESANKEGSHWVLPTKPRRSSRRSSKSSRISKKVVRKEKKRKIQFSSPSYERGGNRFLNRLISANGEGGYWTNLSVRGRKRSCLRIASQPKTPRKKIPVSRSPDNWTPEAKKCPNSRIVQVVAVEAPHVVNLTFEHEKKDTFAEFLGFVAKLFRHRDSCSVKTIVDAFVMSQHSSEFEVVSMLRRLENMNRCMVHNGVVYAV